MKSQTHPCSILKIKSPFIYVIEDFQAQKPQQKQHKKSTKPFTLELQITNQSNQPFSKQFYYHLLPKIIQKDTIISYQLIDQKFGKFLAPKDDVRKGHLYLNDQNIINLYKDAQQLTPSNQIKEYAPEQIIECFIVKVECLKLIMLNLQNLKYITFYFSEFKLVRPQNLHPKESWQAAQKYFIQELEGCFVQIKVNGTQKYRQEMNVYGQILKMNNGDDIKQKIIADGYVELSKNASKYLSEQVIEKFNAMAQQAKSNYSGIWGLKQNKHQKKSSNQAEQIKYKKWEMWLNEKSQPKFKNIQDESKQILTEMKKILTGNIDFHKGRTLLGALQVMFQNVEDKKNLKNLHEGIKILSNTYLNMQVTLVHNNNNVEFLKFYSKCLTFCIFYLEKMSNLVDLKAKEVFPSNSQFQKVLKTAFKTCYIGNETFNQRFFGKKKQANYENFSFDSAYLNGGISSYSQQSDYDEDQQSKYQNKQSKKLASAHTKIRINSTYLISLIFKFYPSIVEVHWQICVRSNILTNDFFDHLKKQKISADSTNMSQAERKQLTLLFKNNFGDPSLLLLTIFQRNTKVRTNALNCIYSMIVNFQGKKMINTTESVYIEKLLKQTKSSYIPKSYIIFSGFKNTLYFLLFTLKYEKNLQIIEITFKTLCELCNQCSLLDKLEFEDGMKLLMENYIQPVLAFPWNIVQLEQLKIVCISFLSVLVSTQKRWQQIQNNYLMSEGDANINFKLLETLKLYDSNKNQNSRIFEEIVKYFTKLPKQYFESMFFNLKPNLSVWQYLSEKSLERVDPIFSTFISEIFKFNFDQIKLQEENSKTDNADEKRRANINQNKNKNQLLLPYLQKFIPIYSTLTTNQNYMNLINILTNIQYSEWTDESEKSPKLKKCKQFTYHIFQSLTGAKLPHRNTKQVIEPQYPSIKEIQQNSLVRICMIKLLGYMSFCEQFQKQEIIVPSIDLLLQYAKKYKSPNSVIKITWAISNWAKVELFTNCIKKKQLQASINYLIEQSSSDKEKIASNSTRGIGFFLKQKQPTEAHKQLLSKCRTSIIKNLQHTIVKVRTNSTKTLRSMINQLNQKQIQRISLLLQQNILKNNYHLQSQTLMLIKEMGTPIQKKRLVKLYLTVLKTLLNQVELEYEFSEIRAIKQLRKMVLVEVVDMIDMVKEEESVDVFISIYAYLVDCYQEDKASMQKENKILEKGFEKGEQVQKLIFNIKNKINYDQQNVISTQTTLKGFQFTAKKSDLSLIEKIKQCAQNRKQYSLCSQWSQLQTVGIDADHVSIGNLYI